MVQDIKTLQEQEHALQKESLNVRLKVEHIDTAITECHNKMKHWEKEVHATLVSSSRFQSNECVCLLKHWIARLDLINFFSLEQCTGLKDFRHAKFL